MKGKSLLSDVSWNHLSLSGDRVFLWVAGARTCTLVDVQKSSSLVLTEWVWIHSSLESANPGLLPTLTWPLGKAYSYILWLIAWNSKGKLWSDDLWVLFPLSVEGLVCGRYVFSNSFAKVQREKGRNSEGNFGSLPYISFDPMVKLYKISFFPSLLCILKLALNTAPIIWTVSYLQK